jgi:uncharacterized protein YegL
MHSNQLLPIYVVCDESLSMSGHLDALNANLCAVHREVHADPRLAERTLLCLIGFSQSPTVLRPLGRPTLSGEQFRCGRSETNFGATFRFLREVITRDLASWRTAGRRIRRPAVLFISDGQPTDPATWPADFAALTDPAWLGRPNVIALGIGDADPVTIGRIGTFRSFICRDGESQVAALRELADLVHERSMVDPSLFA